MLETRGFDAMSIEAVAAQAGVAKTTIYRWWPGKSELAVDAFFALTQDELALPDTGDARADFAAQITELAALLNGRRGAILATMLGGARTDRHLATALSERWREPRRKWGQARMARAIADGQLRPGVHPLAALNLMYGPLYSPLLFGQPVPDAAMVQAHLDIALGAIFT